MKTIKKIIKQQPIYLNDWKDKEEVAIDFEDSDINNLNILFASYTQGYYEGDAWVLFEKDGKLFEVDGGHCSCYGLEGQFEPKEVSLEELEHRLTKGTFGEDCGNFKNELKQFLGIN